MPITIKNFKLGFALNFSLNIPTAKANSIQLNRFEQSVAIGNVDLKLV
jgi:hypothetical protein